MDQMFGQPLLAAQGEGVTGTAWWPRVDITEDEKEYLVKAELPGVKKEEIKVTVRDGNLTLSGERKAEKEERAAAIIALNALTAALNGASRCRATRRRPKSRRSSRRAC
jgi:HSP20 family molecular chaperone IbpA